MSYKTYVPSNCYITESWLIQNTVFSLKQEGGEAEQTASIWTGRGVGLKSGFSFPGLNISFSGFVSTTPLCDYPYWNIKESFVWNNKEQSNLKWEYLLQNILFQGTKHYTLDK